MEATPRPPVRSPSPNVVLTGFMGTGKTTVGRLLADELGFEFVDTDHLIEERHGPIPRIFAELGEEGFRRLERTVAGELADRRGLVIATGGRMMVDPVNAEVLGATADVFCLAATVDTIIARVAPEGNPTDRPLLAAEHGDVRPRIEALLRERTEAYARFHRVDTDDRSPAQIAAEIVSRRFVD